MHKNRKHDIYNETERVRRFSNMFKFNNILSHYILRKFLPNNKQILVNIYFLAKFINKNIQNAFCQHLMKKTTVYYCKISNYEYLSALLRH